MFFKILSILKGCIFAITLQDKNEYNWLDSHNASPDENTLQAQSRG